MNRKGVTMKMRFMLVALGLSLAPILSTDAQVVSGVLGVNNSHMN